MARTIGLALLAMTIVANVAEAGERPRVFPTKALLRGPDAVQQIAIESPDDRDLAAKTIFTSSNPTVASVDASGLITATGDGGAVVSARVGTDEITIPVTVRDFVTPPPIHFTNQIVPIFTKLGCNSGGCHGKSGGQNGFRLSLLGFEPELDYETLVNEGRGRRLFPAAPERSLLLTKATARVPHGGGRKLDPRSHEATILSRWIASGMPVGPPDAPSVSRIEMFPVSRTMTSGQRRQLVVTAVYSDGSTEDVTRFAQYQSNEPEVVIVGEGGQIEARTLAGQAAVMARYQGQVAVFRATVPFGTAAAQLDAFKPVNFVDEFAAKRWKALGITPSEPCTDAEFIRRTSLDIAGTMPTSQEVQAFVESKEAGKRLGLVNRLLDSPNYASFFATKWGDVLRNKREGNPLFQANTYRFHDWIRKSLANNVPYDQFARAILTASGSSESSPPTAWYRHLKTPEQFVDDTAQVFLGMRLQCARCHHHPFESWSQDDYFGLAAYYAKVGKKPSPNGQKLGRQEQVIHLARSGEVLQPKSGKKMAPKPPGGLAPVLAPTDDPRRALADWMSDPKNPFFARAVVNRYWSHFFGRGICEPIDDLRVTNPPTDPELLDALADHFVKCGYDLKALVRLICTSQVYGLSSIPNDTNARDRQSFARHYPRRMPAEVLLDAISQVTGSPSDFAALPKGTRAIELPDESVSTSFLDSFGRPKRDTACECERVTDASLGQSLVLLNSAEIQQKVANETGRAALLVKDTRSDAQKVDDIFWSALARAPSSTESAVAVAHVKANKETPRKAFEDILWAVVNTKEFQFNK
ncbi:MAG: Ig-like protein [Planctomycetota bacterium]|nr:Ig-like protein [Planctomycetota bacterium]